jgi:serine/threonine-protein kinase
LSVAIQIGTALWAAHRQNIVHRDLKPENVIIQRDGTVKVVGIGKLRDGVATADRLRPPLTPLYAAPEQLARELVDERADVYARGC